MTEANGLGRTDGIELADLAALDDEPEDHADTVADDDLLEAGELGEGPS